MLLNFKVLGHQPQTFLRSSTRKHSRKRTPEHELSFNKLKSSLTSNTELTIPDTKHTQLVAVLFQLNEDNKMKVTTRYCTRTTSL